MMGKRAIVPLLIVVAGSVFFYMAVGPANVPARIAADPAPATSTVEARAAASSSPQPSSAPQEPVAARKPPAATGSRVQIGSLVIPVEVARTSAEVQKGLSGRPSLEPGKGMLFLFSKADTYRFWMPDMRFPIDIIWISSGKKVIGVSANVSNEFDPANPEFYTPPSPAQYVLEVNAGFAERMDIEAGDNVTFLSI